MIEEFINSAVIIDDKEQEISALKLLLESKNIWVKHYTLDKLHADKVRLNNRKIIFLDLHLNESEKLVANIALIRKMFSEVIGKDSGTYGVVLWTKHFDEIDEFKQRIQTDGEKYNLPIFIVGLDKNNYKTKDTVTNIYNDLNNVLDHSIAASFFVKWNVMVNEARDNTIINIYSLINDFAKRDANLKFILFKLAHNLNNIPLHQLQDYPLHHDAIKAFNDMLSFEINLKASKIEDIFKDYHKIFFVGDNSKEHDYRKSLNGEYFFDGKVVKKEGQYVKELQKLDDEIENIYSEINYRILIDYTNLAQDKIFPGNVYQVTGNDLFQVEEAERPKDSIPIVIEMTPPCDYSNLGRMKKPRCIAGFLREYSKEKYREYRNEHHYKEIWPIKVQGLDNPQFIIFDFRYLQSLSEDELKDPSKYKLLFRAKNQLFADVLQKYTSHSARLGLSIIHN